MIKNINVTRSEIEFTELIFGEGNNMPLRQSNECAVEVGHKEGKATSRGNNNLVSGKIGRYALILILVIFAYVVQWFWIK